jgi:hypothetical protein
MKWEKPIIEVNPMKKTRVQIQEDLEEKKAKRSSKNCWIGMKPTPAPALMQIIEDVVLELREALGLEFASSILAGQEKGLP